MSLIIDRFEGDYAVVENEKRQTKNIERNLLPSEVKEGDVIELVGKFYVINKQETEKRKKEIAKLTEGLWE